MLQKLLMMCVVAGCAVQSSAQADDVAPARVRVYQEGEVTLYPGAYCYSDDNPQKIVAAETGFTIFSTHKRLGMPTTDDIKLNFNEYAVDGGKPVTVKLFWQAEKNGIKASCGPLASTFYPQAGHDYDISLGYVGNCFIQIRELFPLTKDKAAAKPASFGPAYACKAG